jgi:tetratricopeptide (TPR) repeat protein
MRRGIFSVLLAGFFLVVSTTNCKNPNLSGGILHFDQKRYERARETLLKAIVQEPSNGEAYFWLGKAYAELDSTEMARRSFAKADELAGPKFPNMKKDVENAMDHYWSLRHNDGLQFAKTAQDSLSAAKDAQASLSRAQASLAAQKASNAPQDDITTSERAVNSLTAEHKRTDAAAKKNFRLALNQFKKAVVYNPKKEETPRNMGVCYFNLGQVDSGLVALETARTLSPAGDSKASKLLFGQYRDLGDQAAEKGTLDDYRAAIRFYSEAEKLNSGDCDLLYSMGVVHYQLAEADTAKKIAEYRNAVDYFEKTLKCKEDDQDALFNAASLYLELKECDKGIALAKKLLDLNPHEGRYYDMVGRLNDCLGKKSERVAGLVFSRALKSGDVVPPENLKGEIEKLGGTSDAMRKYREEGKPEEVRSFIDAGGADYLCWFYWSRGKALAFIRGEYKYEIDFKPQKEAPTGGTK